MPDHRIIPCEYLDLSLREIVALNAHAGPRGEGVELEAVHDALDALAQRLEREQAGRDAEQREWLGKQIDNLTTGDGGRS